MKAVASRDRTVGNRNGLGASTLDRKKVWTSDQAGAGGINNRNRSGYFDRDTGEAMCGIMANKKSVWTVTTRPFKEAHFATFPEALIRPCILAGSRPGGIIYDPFFGAGTTGVVAHKLGRKFIGSELNPEYVAIAQRRLEPLLMQSNLFEQKQ
jgi:DNA modification methylase